MEEMARILDHRSNACGFSGLETMLMNFLETMNAIPVKFRETLEAMLVVIRDTLGADETLKAMLLDFHETWTQWKSMPIVFLETMKEISAGEEILGFNQTYGSND